MSFIQWCCETGPKSHLSREISGRGRRRSREQGNHWVRDFRFTTFTIFFYFFFSINLLYHIFLHFFYTHPQPTTFSYTLNLCVILGRSSLFKSSSAVSVFSFRLCPQNKSWMNALTNFSDTKWNRQTHRKTQRLRTRATRSSLWSPPWIKPWRRWREVFPLWD